MSEYWKEVGRQKISSPDGSSLFTVITAEHELPHGKLVLVCNGYGEPRNGSIVFVPAPTVELGVYR